MFCTKTITVSTMIQTKCTNNLGYDTATVQTLNDTDAQKIHTSHSQNMARLHSIMQYDCQS